MKLYRRVLGDAEAAPYNPMASALNRLSDEQRSAGVVTPGVQRQPSGHSLKELRRRPPVIAAGRLRNRLCR